MVLVGVLVTKAFVTKPLEETVIFHHFGFNHICNVFDHQPSRTRIRAAHPVLHRADGALRRAVTISAPGMRCGRDAWRRGAHVLGRHDAVHPPQRVLHVHVVRGELPTRRGSCRTTFRTAMLQLAIGLLAINEVAFLRYTGTLPFGVSRWIADAYLVVLIATTLLCQLAVFSLLLRSPHSRQSTR